MTTPEQDGPEIDHMYKVDRNPGAHEPTEPDEDQALRDLYGEPDADGIFRGQAVTG